MAEVTQAMVEAGARALHERLMPGQPHPGGPDDPAREWPCRVWAEEVLRAALQQQQPPEIEEPPFVMVWLTNRHKYVRFNHDEEAVAFVKKFGGGMIEKRNRYCKTCDFYTDHVSTAHDGLAARGLLLPKPVR
jgi:hypothetical protein